MFFMKFALTKSKTMITQRRLCLPSYLKGKMLTGTVHCDQRVKTKLLKESDNNIFQESGESEISSKNSYRYVTTNFTAF